MHKFNFVGTESIWRERRLSRFGEVVEMNDTETASALAGETGLPLVRAVDFDSVGFTPEELNRYATPASRMLAPLDWWEKFHRVQAFVLTAPPAKIKAADNNETKGGK